jgi:hypothetical protein
VELNIHFDKSKKNENEQGNQESFQGWRLNFHKKMGEEIMIIEG